MANKFNYLIDRYDTIRFILQAIYIYGCYNEKQLLNELQISEKTYKTLMKRLRFYLPKKKLYIENPNKHNIYSIKFDRYSTISNLLFNSYKTKTFKWVEDFRNHFLFMHILNSDSRESEFLSVEQLCGEIDDLMGNCNINGLSNYGHTHLYDRLNTLVELGIMSTGRPTSSTEDDTRAKIGYNISHNILENYDSEELNKICKALNLFINISPLSSIGYFCQETLRNYINYTLGDNDSYANNPFVFKDTYYWKMLDDEVLLHIITALENSYQLHFDYSPKGLQSGPINVITTPLKLLTHLKDNRQYLFAETDNKFTSYQLSCISNVRILTKKINQKKEYNFENYWTGRGPQYPKPAKVIIDFIVPDKKMQPVIMSRLKNTKQHGKITEINSEHWVYTVLISDPVYSMIPWIRSFAPYAHVRPSHEHDLKERLQKSWKEILENYVKK